MSKEESISDHTSEASSIDLEKNVPAQQTSGGRRGRLRLPLLVGVLTAISAIVGAVAAWQWVKDQQNNDPSAAATPDPPTDDLGHHNNPHASPFEKNYPPIPPSLGAVNKQGEDSSNGDCPAICSMDRFGSVVDHLYENLAPNLHYLQTLVVETWWIRIDEGAPPSTTSTSTVVGESLAISHLKDIAVKLGKLADSLTKANVAEFYSYYISRQLYGEIGAQIFPKVYSLYDGIIQKCMDHREDYGSGIIKCPELQDQIDNATAVQYLLNHADNTFSSINSGGHPFPWWSKPDGSGFLFKPNTETGLLYPVSGSGVNMSAPLDSLTQFFEHQKLQTNALVETTSREWSDLVESNPVYAWFMASLTPADEGTICNNGDLPGTKTGVPSVDSSTQEQATRDTYHWCSSSDVPNAENPGNAGSYSKQHFARMWYDMLYREYSKMGASIDVAIEESKHLQDCCLPVLVNHHQPN